MMVVISTGNGSEHKVKCLASVANQDVDFDFKHVYRDAAVEGDPGFGKGAMQNVWEMVSDLPPDTIVVQVDGDDWLSTPNALKRVKEVHDQGAWLTWGSFEFTDGRPGIARAYDPVENCREKDWGLTHLKTYRAGLFQKIKKDDLFRAGEWLVHARDCAIMFPMYEMCPYDRKQFIPEVLYTYNLLAAFEWTANEAEFKHEMADVQYVRSRTPYTSISRLEGVK